MINLCRHLIFISFYIQTGKEEIAKLSQKTVLQYFLANNDNPFTGISEAAYSRHYSSAFMTAANVTQMRYRDR